MKFSPDTALLYVALRSAAAVLLALRLRRAGEGGSALLGQVTADATAALFVIGVSRADVRTAVGGWWVALFLYVVAWEGWRLRLYLDDVLDPPAGEAEGIVRTELMAAWAGTPVVLVWQALAVAPALAAGVMLVFEALFPGYWVFPTA